MPEGVECLIVAEAIQKWAREIDLEKKGYIKFYLSDISSFTITKNSPINFEEFNRLYGFLLYPNITTFGKTIFLPSSNGYCMMVQLGMTGTFAEVRDNYTRIEFKSSLRGSDVPLFYNDMRKFGHLMLFDKSKYPRNVANLLKNSIDWRNKRASTLFALRARKIERWRESEIKPVIMNQQLIAGIGNIYASEGMFASKIHPKAKVKDLSDTQLTHIINSTQKIMHESYALGGMSVRTFSVFGKRGNGKKILNVYGKYAMLCKVCNAAYIQVIKQEERSTFFCPKCQNTGRNDEN